MQHCWRLSIASCIDVSVMKKGAWTVLWCALSLLSGCALWSPGPQGDLTLGQGTVQSWRLEGRIAVRQPTGSESGQLEWQLRGGMEQHLELRSPLGTTVALVDSSPLQTHLILSDHRDYRAGDPETLTQTVLGYALPLQGLPWWLRGQADPGLPAQVERDAEHHPQRLSQQGWVMTYADWRAVGGEWLPGTIRLVREDLQIRIKVDHWVLEQKE
ncbi:outer-membrane lipoprotein LolB precursor [Ferrovum myxofaciens]|uniref:Outer-membrane lipoprotein LolB n=3 Tax=root TaxID=1 RepID=A0A149W1R1_9PROT|nr:outer-membrane lipoprotein LolB precursor [Ferrovum myxofaciens]